MSFRTDHVVYGWLPQRVEPLACFVRGAGVHLWDARGRRFMDLCAGQINVNIGYGHPRVLGAMCSQMADLVYVAPNFETAPRTALAKKIVSRMPPGLQHVFFTNGGSDAIETAIKIARAVTGRTKIYSAWRSYHGASAGASAISGDPRRLFVEPALVGSRNFHSATCYRCAFGNRAPPDCAFSCLQSLRNTLLLDGPETVAAIVLEPISGTSGLYVPPPEFISGVRELCDEHGMLLILDETMTGWGRTGRWFAWEHYGVTPDILTTAKGITSAYVPLGAVIMTSRVRDFFLDRPFVGGLTTEGHALACAAGVANIEVLQSENLIERSRVLGDYLLTGLQKLMERHPSVGDVRGKGLFACLELTSNRETRTPLAGYRDQRRNVSKELTRQFFERNLLVIARWDFVFIAPPLVIEQHEIDTALDALDEVLMYTDSLSEHS